MYNQIQNSVVWKFPHEVNRKQLPVPPTAMLLVECQKKTIEIIKFKLYIIHIAPNGNFVNCVLNGSSSIVQLQFSLEIHQTYGVRKVVLHELWDFWANIRGSIKTLKNFRPGRAGQNLKPIMLLFWSSIKIHATSKCLHNLTLIIRLLLWHIKLS